MPIRRIKDTTRLISKAKIRGRGRRHYLHAYLWRDRAAMIAADGDGDSSASGQSTMAMHCPNAHTITITPGSEDQHSSPPLLGELHFVADDWTTEVVAHELCHALFHRLSALGQGDVFALEMADEEPICYEFGQWFEQVYAWLWEVNPHGKHSG